MEEGDREGMEEGDREGMEEGDREGVTTGSFSGSFDTRKAPKKAFVCPLR